MPLSETEREITKTVVHRFFTTQQATTRRLLIRRFRSIDALQRLTSIPVFKRLGGGDSESYLPMALAFHYCGHADILRIARTSAELTLRVLQKLFDAEMDKVDFTVAEVEAHAQKIFDIPPLLENIRLGLYFAAEFGALSSWTGSSDQVGMSRSDISRYSRAQ